MGEDGGGWRRIAEDDVEDEKRGRGVKENHTGYRDESSVE